MTKRICFSFLFASLLLSSAAHDKLGYEPPKLQARAEIRWVRPICVETNRYIGWPSVCRLKNGDLIAVFSGDRDGHICPYGKVQMVRSIDDGETWSAPMTIANGPIDDRDAGIVQLPDGEILVTYFTSVAYRRSKILAQHPEYKKFDDQLTDDVRRQSLGNFAVRSRDNGKTWTKPEKLVWNRHDGRGDYAQLRRTFSRWRTYLADVVPFDSRHERRECDTAYVPRAACR